MAFSCEERRTKAYSEDIRWRIVHQTELLRLSCQRVATNLQVDPSTVSRIVQLFRQTGNVLPKKYPSNQSTAKLTSIDKLHILEVVLQKPGIYLREVQDELSHLTGTLVDVSTIMRFLHDSGFTRQKMIIRATQQSAILRAQYLSDMTVYNGHPEMFVFVDETGSDRRDCMRRFGYSVRGKPAVSEKLLWRGQRASAICAISMEGVLDCYVTTSTVTSDTFEDFITNSLSSKLQAFNGHNPNSVIVLDNAAIHHSDNVVQAIQSTGAIAHFLPPYCPDLNPIEECFSKVKSLLKANEETMNYLDTETAVLVAVNNITAHNCEQWIIHAGYT